MVSNYLSVRKILIIKERAFLVVFLCCVNRGAFDWMDKASGVINKVANDRTGLRGQYDFVEMDAE